MESNPAILPYTRQKLQLPYRLPSSRWKRELLPKEN